MSILKHCAVFSEIKLHDENWGSLTCLNNRTGAHTIARSAKKPQTMLQRKHRSAHVTTKQTLKGTHSYCSFSRHKTTQKNTLPSVCGDSCTHWYVVQAVWGGCCVWHNGETHDAYYFIHIHYLMLSLSHRSYSICDTTSILTWRRYCVRFQETCDIHLSNSVARTPGRFHSVKWRSSFGLISFICHMNSSMNDDNISMNFPRLYFSLLIVHFGLI